MNDVTMYTSQGCSYCRSAEQLLKNKGVETLTQIYVDSDEDSRNQMIALTGRRTVPQIFIGGVHIGGFDDLSLQDRNGNLDELLGTGEPRT